MSICNLRPHKKFAALPTEITSYDIGGNNDASFQSEISLHAYSRSYQFNISGSRFPHCPEHNHMKINVDSEDQILLHFTQLQIMPLLTSNDFHWFSEYICFIRAQCLEFFEATQADVTSRENSKTIGKVQVVIRCHFCEHQP